jgi:hypothetical protein
MRATDGCGLRSDSLLGACRRIDRALIRACRDEQAVRVRTVEQGSVNG